MFAIFRGFRGGFARRDYDRDGSWGVWVCSLVGGRDFFSGYCSEFLFYDSYSVFMFLKFLVNMGKYLKQII